MVLVLSGRAGHIGYFTSWRCKVGAETLSGSTKFSFETNSNPMPTWQTDFQFPRQAQDAHY